MKLTKDICMKQLEILSFEQGYLSIKDMLKSPKCSMLPYKTMYQLIKEHFELKEKYSKLLDDVHDYRHEAQEMKLVIRNLCKHFGVKDIDKLRNIYINPPLKFEELKVGMWVWDTVYEIYFQIEDIRGDVIYPCEDYFCDPCDVSHNMWFKFEKNRFYRKEVK